jgi:hypothetical protein
MVHKICVKGRKLWLLICFLPQVNHLDLYITNIMEVQLYIIWVASGQRSSQAKCQRRRGFLGSKNAYSFSPEVQLGVWGGFGCFLLGCSYGFGWVVSLVGLLYLGFIFWGLLMSLAPYTYCIWRALLGFLIYNITYQNIIWVVVFFLFFFPKCICVNSHDFLVELLPDHWMIL